MSTFSSAVLHGFILLGDLIAVLTLEFFAVDRSKLTRPLFEAPIAFVVLNTISTVEVLMNYGSDFDSLKQPLVSGY